ncbi:zeta toxin family protein, partial [Lysobacter sp. 2RAB21]
SGRATAELHGDAITVDPDDIRDYHPNVSDFRKAHPYTWSGLTHADASQWADELLDATVKSKKNLIFRHHPEQWTMDFGADQRFAVSRL